MSTSWRKRKSRLNALLSGAEDEDARGLALDRILHGQNVIGKTAKTTQVDELKFGDDDVTVVGTLEYGQFGVVDVVTCKFDNKVYVRKSIEKRFALRTQDQCSPQLEREILLRALKSRTSWAPHLLCAYQSPTHLNMVMDYAEGGTLWDVLESSPHDGKVLETDLLWWAPQAVSAIAWCHAQDFVHRDIKPHNFVITSDARLLLIDFGSAAPLLPRAADGSQTVPKRYCLVPCGTCDYISPEILQSHEEALVALEMADEAELTRSFSNYEPGGYGRETDWWSFGAMLYEMAYGVAPFFADDIRVTYSKIMDYSHSLRFTKRSHLSTALQDLLRRLLTTSELRLGRQSADDVMSHPFFESIKWNKLEKRPKPEDLHLPQFVYSASLEPPAPALSRSTSTTATDESSAHTFSFSALFQSSPISEPAHSVLQPTPTTPSAKAGRSILREATSVVASFIGFSWGPRIDAFPDTNTSTNTKKAQSTPPAERILKTPRPLNPSTPMPARLQSLPASAFASTPQRTGLPFMTPVRQGQGFQTPFAHLQSTARRTAQKRAVSDREAMKQLVDCVGMSARKRVLESGRKPRVLGTWSAGKGSGSGGKGEKGSALKALRFDRSVVVLGGESGGSYRMDSLSASASGTGSLGSSLVGAPVNGTGNGNEEDAIEQTEQEEESSGVADMSYSPTPMARPRSGLGMAPTRSASVLSMGRPRSSSSSAGSVRSRTGSGTFDITTLTNGEGSIRSLAQSFASGFSIPLPQPPSFVLPTPTRELEYKHEEYRDGDGDVFRVQDVVEKSMLDEPIDALEKRYSRLMGDIRGIRIRLNDISARMK